MIHLDLFYHNYWSPLYRSFRISLYYFKVHWRALSPSRHSKSLSYFFDSLRVFVAPIYVIYTIWAGDLHVIYNSLHGLWFLLCFALWILMSFIILQFRVLVCSVLASKPSNIFFCFIDGPKTRMEFEKKYNRTELKSDTFILTIRKYFEHKWG